MVYNWYSDENRNERIILGDSGLRFLCVLGRDGEQQNYLYKIVKSRVARVEVSRCLRSHPFSCYL